MLPVLKVVVAAVSVIAPVGFTLWDRYSKKSEFISDRLYCGYMNNEFTEEEVKALCKEHGISFPPKPMHRLIQNNVFGDKHETNN